MLRLVILPPALPTIVANLPKDPGSFLTETFILDEKYCFGSTSFHEAVIQSSFFVSLSSSLHKLEYT